jgi:hypothetical protein
VIPNFYSAVLLRCFSTSYQTCLVLPSIVAAFSLIVVLARLVHEFCADPDAVCLAPALFLLSGGLGFTRFFDPAVRNEHHVDYVHHWGFQRFEYWFQSVIHILLPQRASLFSLPLAWSILLMIVAAPRSLDLRWFTAIGAIVALLPQVQPHSIVATAQYGLVFALLTFPWSGRWAPALANYAVLAAVALVAGGWQMAPFLHRMRSFVRLRLLWREETVKPRNFFTLWWYGLGLFFVIAVFVGPFTLNGHQRVMYAPALVVFAVANFVLYQPWHLDNTKVFNAAWLPLAVAVVAQAVARLRRIARWAIVPTVAIVVVLVASGTLAVGGVIAHAYPIWGYPRLAWDLGDFVKAVSAPKSVWITDSDHTHPVVTLGGRQVLAGYPGWLVSHGLSDTERTSAMRELAKNPEDVRWADMWGTEFVCVNEEKYSEFPFRPTASSRNWKLLWDTRPYRIWKRVNITDRRAR